MAKDVKVLRTVYVDPDVDDRLRAAAARCALSKAELFRRYLTAGMKAAKADPAALEALQLRRDDVPLVLRTLYIDPKLDDQLRTQAFDQRTSKNDLMRRYVQLGMSVALTDAETPSA